MIRKIIKIDEAKCNGCGLCAGSCHEGAIEIVNGKAKLLRDDYCDGLGNCLPVCPTGAILFEEREAAGYNEEAVKNHIEAKKTEHAHAGGGPGSRQMTFSKHEQKKQEQTDIPGCEIRSRLNQWPIQLKLAPINAAFFKNASLLIAADCTAFAYGDFHNKFIEDRITLIGCPKLDEGGYAEKLTEIIKRNEIKDITVVRMEVPCCGGIAAAAMTALQNAGKAIPLQIITISTDGHIIEKHIAQ